MTIVHTFTNDGMSAVFKAADFVSNRTYKRI